VSDEASFHASALAEELNRLCHCIAVDPAKLRDRLESGPETAGVYASILKDQPNLFSSSPVFLAREQLDQMQAVVAAIETVVASDSFQRHALEEAPAIARREHGPRGVFLGYDFHLGHDGPQLIEINTNAGGALLNVALAGAQQACCEEVSAVLGASTDPEHLQQELLEMFLSEWRRQRGNASLRSIAIVDEAPEAQFLYPEFLLFRELFRSAGLEAEIIDVADLRFDGASLTAQGRKLDFVYNRLVDFYLEASASSALRAAYESGATVVSPHPRAYALHADKRLLTVFSDFDRLKDWGIDSQTLDVLRAGVPDAQRLDPAQADQFWKARKRYFFKPATGYGSKAAYRGDKLTRSTWDEILTREYIAQRIVVPSERTLLVDGVELPLKLDLRNYVYDGRVQLVAARLYRGQTTNFRTAGGGFAPVFTGAKAA
jgi:hypothetical protein